jgi:RNA polymerase sigma-70 factor (ECF subfamily)
MNLRHHGEVTVNRSHPANDFNNQSSFGNLSDKELWLQFKSGNEAAFIFIYQKFFDNLVNYSYQFTQSEDLIKDCVQELFIYIRNKRSTLANTNNIKLYLFKSCKNNLLNNLKKDQKHRSLTDLENDFFPPTISTEENIINLQTREIRERSLEVAIDKLSAREREIIYYFYFEDMGYKEIAELLEYKEIKSVRSLLYKSLQKLRDHIISIIIIVFAFQG